MVKNNNNRRLYEMLREKTLLHVAKHFMVGKKKRVKIQLDSRAILKQEDFCGAIALTYIVENCLDLP